MATEYATTDELNEFMVMKGEIPSPTIVGDSRLVEEVGTGDNSETIFYIDHAYIIADSYTIYYGATEAASLSQPLTETTHYTLDKDMGILTLTSAGVTLVALNNIYSAYSYNLMGFKDSELQDQLDRTESTINKLTSNKWVDGSIDTPLYDQNLDEKHRGLGMNKRNYFTLTRPLPDVSTTIDGDEAVGQTELTVVSTAGFPSSGYLGIGSEKVTYASKTDTTFTCTATTAIHLDGVSVLPYVIEASNTPSGAEPTWNVLEADEDYDMDLPTGRINLSKTTYNNTQAYAYELAPQRGIPNRFRISYLRGNETIPNDINQLTLMIASADLLHRAVRKAHVAGLNDYNPDLIDVDKKWIDSTIQTHKNAKISSE